MSNAGLKLLAALEHPVGNNAILNNSTYNNMLEPVVQKKKNRPRHKNKKSSIKASSSTLPTQLSPDVDVMDQGILLHKSNKNVRKISNSNLQKPSCTTTKSSPSTLSLSPLPGSSKNKKKDIKSVIQAGAPLVLNMVTKQSDAAQNLSKPITALATPPCVPSSPHKNSRPDIAEEPVGSYISPSQRKEQLSLIDANIAVKPRGYIPPSLRQEKLSLNNQNQASEVPSLFSEIENVVKTLREDWKRFSPLQSELSKSRKNQSKEKRTRESCDEQLGIPSTSKISNLPINFHIKKIRNPKEGTFFRHRNTKFKYINLKSFITLGQQPCCEFRTKTVTKLVSSLEKLEIENVPTPAKKKVPKKKKKAKGEDTRERSQPFPAYITLEDVEAGLKDGTLVKGYMRINPKNSRDSYVSNEDTSLADYYLTSVLDRNRAFDGDEVILKIKAADDWIDGKKTATVVYIKEKVHPRVCVGQLTPKTAEYAIFEPRDKRCPKVRIHEISWPNGFKERPQNYKDIIIMVKILTWTVPEYAIGIVIECLGQAGDLRVESLSILKEFGLDVTPFNEDVIRECLPKTLEIPEEEFLSREDIRKDCVFTIDPETARDLDDAVSVKCLENGNYEVGVHISDASFYLEEGNELDQQVCRKATTIYMVNEAFHMLPLELCLFCSLLPGQDKLSFSVFWEMTAEGEILSKRFCRTIMNSCTKLAYEHAQNVIENPDKEFTSDDFPQILNGFGPADIAGTIKVLQKMAVNLRQKRVDRGALKIDQVKLIFSLDPKTGKPLEFSKYENKEAHRLIEEFMLLANISVAEKIYEHFPSLAFLRCHEPPKHTMLVELQNSLASYGIHIDISSSGGISSSLKKYITDDYAGVCRSVVLNHLTAKAMTRAKYFCASIPDPELGFKHYALSVPIYTHFTSPIRRYADIMVHRILAASLGYEEPPKWNPDYVSAVATNCNLQKYNAKRAGEASSELYLSHYVSKHKPFVEDCVVVEVRERSFDCIVLKTGSVVRIYNNNSEIGSKWTTESIPIDNGNQGGKKPLKLMIKFCKTRKYPEVELIVEIFSIVKISLECKPKSYKLEGMLCRPLPTVR